MTKRAIIWLAASTTDDAKYVVPITTQQQEALVFCEDRGWTVIDTLEVPRHKFALDYPDYAQEMLYDGISAFQNLAKHWEAKDFDVLVVKDKHRFGQSYTLLAYIIERTLNSGATVYSMVDGLITEENYNIWLSMAHFSPANSVEGMVERRKQGVDARVRKGLPPNGRVPISHRVVRDENNGKALYVELNEETAKMWGDLAQLILEGSPWRQIGTRMYEEFGHTNPEGEPYPYKFFYKLVYTPSFWGAIALNFKHQSFAAWVYDETEPVPEGVTINRNVHPAVWTGELAERIKAELRRREEENQDRKRNTGVEMFADVFVCADCGGHMVHGIDGMWTVWRCSKHGNSITDRKAKQYIDGLLRQMVEADNPQMLSQTPSIERDNGIQSANQLHEKMDGLQKQLERLLLQQALIGDAVLRTQYDAVIQSTYQELKQFHETHSRFLKHASDATKTNQQHVYQQFRKASVDDFWEANPEAINRTLLGLMGIRRLVVKDGSIIGVAEL